MVSPNNAQALGGHPSFTRYDPASGTGWIKLEGDKKPRAFRVEGEARISEEHGCLAVEFARRIPGVARQQISYCALPDGAVVVFSRWQALNEIKVAELVDHPFRWIEIDRMLPKWTATQGAGGVWSIEGKLRMQIIGGSVGEALEGGVNGAVKRGFRAARDEVLQDSACVYQALVPGREPVEATGNSATVKLGAWTIHCAADGHLTFEK